MVEEDNRVIVRVWTSGSNSRYRGKGVGHVSIEIPYCASYYSLWPDWDNADSASKGFLGSVTGQFMAGYQSSAERTPNAVYDLEAEQRGPELTICLYSLNIHAIQNRFDQIKSSLQGWVLIGSNWLINKNKAHSCASLAYDLLKAGGVYELVSSSYSSKFTIASPDSFVSFLISAKNEESKRYPQIKNYTFSDETDLTKSKKSNCSIL